MGYRFLSLEAAPCTSHNFTFIKAYYAYIIVQAFPQHYLQH